MKSFPYRLGIVQRVLPTYRVGFFEMLAAQFENTSLYTGKPTDAESIKSADALQHAEIFPAKNRHLFSGPLYFCLQQNLTDWLESFDPEIVIMEANPRYLNLPGAVKWLKDHKRPIIGWGLGAPKTNGLSGSLQNMLRKRLLFSFDALITYSDIGAQQYAQLGIPSGKIFTAKNAVSPRPEHTMPERNSIKDRKPILLFVGRLQTRKRVDLLINACARLPYELSPEIWVIGDGPDMPRLKQIAAEVYPQTEFFGHLDGTNLEEKFRQADLFVLPGTGGLAVQQAMSFGLPIIAAEADGTQEDLIRSENGWHIEPGSLESLYTHLETALSQPDLLIEKGKASFRIVSEEINLENMVTAFLKAVDFVLEK